MPVFSTPEPVRALIEVSGAWTTVTAGDSAETTVEIRPHNPGRSGDVQLAEQTTVEFADGRLTVRSPRGARWRLRNLVGAGERVDLTLTLPAGSDLEVRGWGDVVSHGTLGALDIDSGMGDLRIDQVTGDVRAKTGMGDIHLAAAGGRAELKTSAGQVRVGRAGAVEAKTSAGDIQVGDGGELRLTTSAGDVRVDRAGGGVEARTSAGDIRLGSVRSGSVTANTSYGLLEIGVAPGSAAWLDVEARHGVVRSELESTDGPGDAEQTVEIRARSGYGDIVLRRSAS